MSLAWCWAWQPTLLRDRRWQLFVPAACRLPCWVCRRRCPCVKRAGGEKHEAPPCRGARCKSDKATGCAARGSDCDNTLCQISFRQDPRVPHVWLCTNQHSAGRHFDLCLPFSPPLPTSPVITPNLLDTLRRILLKLCLRPFHPHDNDDIVSTDRAFSLPSSQRAAGAFCASAGG